jgi:hypothetical protein
MKLNNACGAVVIGLALCAAPGYGQVTLNLSANTGGGIQFNGASDSFQFVNSTNGYQWHVSSESGSSAMGLNGSFNSGPFHYGPITITGSGLTLVQKATVTGGLANFVIFDGSGNLSGTLNFLDVETFATAGGGMNANLSVNLTGVTYSGSNPDLLFLQAHQPGTLDLSFQFSPGMTLTQLSTGAGPYLTSYSASLTVVPEPSSVVLAGLGGLGLLFLRRRK